MCGRMVSGMEVRMGWDGIRINRQSVRVAEWQSQSASVTEMARREGERCVRGACLAVPVDFGRET